VLVLIVCLRFVCGDRLMCLANCLRVALGAPCAHAAQALRRSGGLGGRAPHSFHCFRCLWRLRCFELSTSFSCACSGFEPLFVLTAQAVVCVCGIGACSMLGPRSSACCVLVFANSCSWHVHVSWHFMFWTSVSICELIKFGIWGIFFSWLIHVSDHSLLTKAFQ